MKVSIRNSFTVQAGRMVQVSFRVVIYVVLLFKLHLNEWWELVLRLVFKLVHSYI